MNFQEAALEYKRLKRAYQTGQISAETFEKKVNSMAVSHQGQRWMIGVRSGKWYRHDGTRWLEDTPPPQAPAAVVPPPTEKPASPPPAAEPVQADSPVVRTEDAADFRDTGSRLDIVPNVEAVGNRTTVGNQTAVGNRAEAGSRPADSIHPTRKRRVNRWAVGLIIATTLLIAGILVVSWLFLTGTLEPPQPLAGLFYGASPTPVSTSTPEPTATASQPAPTPTATELPFDAQEALLGSWITAEDGAEYHFHADSSYVYFDPDSGNYAAGSYTLLEDSQILLESMLAEQVIETTRHPLVFTSYDAFTLTDPEGSGGNWERTEDLPADSRLNNPVALLFELAYRLGIDDPDPDCGFDTNDEENEFRFVCLNREDSVSMTWVDQRFSSSLTRWVDRNTLSVSITHESQESFQTELELIETQMESTEPFYDMPAYSSLVDMDWYTIENFAWQNGPWLYRIFRLNVVESSNLPAEASYTAEVLYEIQQGKPPAAVSAAVTTPPTGFFRYAKEIIGAWELRHPTTEIITFIPDGTLNVISELGQYEYDGRYTFTSANRVTFELDAGTVTAGIELDGDVLTLNINGVKSVYDRQEEEQ